jgi:nucleotide-binding universal stress UspA family protein
MREETMTFTSLLVPIDYGPHADRALRVAAEVAAQADLPVELITVTDPRLDPEDDEAEMLRRAEELRPVPCTVSIVREHDVGAALTRALVDRPDALPVIGTAAARTLAEMLDPGVWPPTLHATGRPALVVGPKVVEGDVRPDRLVMAVTASTQPRALARAVCTWADTFDAIVSVVDMVGQGGLASGEAQYTLREVSLALRCRDLPAPISVVHADDLADALRELSCRSPAILAITTGHWTAPDRVHRSLARDVVRSANVPVLLVPADGPLSEGPGTGRVRDGSGRRGPPR